MQQPVLGFLVDLPKAQAAVRATVKAVVATRGEEGEVLCTLLKGASPSHRTLFRTDTVVH